MQRDEEQLLGDADAVQRADSGVDLAHAGHEHKDVTGLMRVDDLLHGIGRLLRDIPLVLVIDILHLHGEAATFRDADGAIIQILLYRLGIQCGGHDEQMQIRTLMRLQSFHQSECDIAEQIALMKFIEENRADIRERGVILQPAQQDAFRHETNARAERSVVIKANLVTDFLAERHIPFPRHARSDGASGDTTRLQHHDLLVPGQPRIQDHLGDLGRFA